jgi:hypothetical protein
MVMVTVGGMICAWLSRQPPRTRRRRPAPAAHRAGPGAHLAPDQDRPAHPRAVAAQTLALRGQDRAPAGGAGPAVRGDGRSGPRGDDRGARTALRQTVCRQGPGQAQAAAARAAPHRDPPRAGLHHLRLRLPDETHRRGRGREARLHPRHLQRRAPHPRQVGLPGAKPWCRPRCPPT